MLAGLGKWLRAAGYDTKIITEPAEDQEIFQEAIAEKRLLLTRDSHFLQMQPQNCVIVLKSTLSINASENSILGS